MSPLLLIWIALRAIARNKVRAALTMLGIVIGVASVIAMVAIGRGATTMVKNQVAAMGQNMLMIMPGSSSSGAIMMGSGTKPSLKPSDVDAILRECPSASAVAIIVRTRAQLVNGSVNWSPSTVQGTNTSFLEVRGWKVVEGESFTEQDVKLAAQVCLVGRTVASQVFPDEDPIGKRVRLKGLPFTVVGVLEKKGSNTFGQDQDDIVLLPWTTTKKKLQGSTFDSVDQLLVGGINEGAMKSLEREVTEALRGARRGRPGQDGGRAEDDFTVRNTTEILTAMTGTTQVMTALLAAIASISLVVGGIGIMNTMLVSVTERTREIGLRMALGARAQDILMQFLVEAATLSFMGGAIGLALGGGGAMAVARAYKWPALLSWDTAVTAVIFSAAVGIFFGFYPAWRASRLDPIEALRYE